VKRLVLALSLAACTPGVATGPSGAGGAPATTGAGGAMGVVVPPRGGPPPARCTESALAPRGLVRLTEAELASSLLDIFP
jgi:hypothetical protein